MKESRQGEVQRFLPERIFDWVPHLALLIPNPGIVTPESSAIREITLSEHAEGLSFFILQGPVSSTGAHTPVLT